MNLLVQHCLLYSLVVAVLSSDQWTKGRFPLFEDDDLEEQLPTGEQYYSDIDHPNWDEDLDIRSSDYYSPTDYYQDNDFSRNRRRETVCEVIRSKERFEEPGYEFIPSYYINTTCAEKFSCEPYFNDDSDSEQFCVVRNAECRTNFKEMTVFKKKLRHKVWLIHKIQRVAVGCCDHH